MFLDKALSLTYVSNFPILEIKRRIKADIHIRSSFKKFPEFVAIIYISCYYEFALTFFVAFGIQSEGNTPKKKNLKTNS